MTKLYLSFDISCFASNNDKRVLNCTYFAGQVACLYEKTQNKPQFATIELITRLVLILTLKSDLLAVLLRSVVFDSEACLMSTNSEKITLLINQTVRLIAISKLSEEDSFCKAL